MSIDANFYLDLAEKEFVFKNTNSFYFDLRRPSGSQDFYQDLEKALQNQTLFKISNFRVTKEGKVKISRPSQISLTMEDLLGQRPHLRDIQEEFKLLISRWNRFDVESFFQSNYWEIKFQGPLIDSCFQVIDFLENNKETISGLYSKQIPHGSSTKLIGKENLLLRLFSHWKKVQASWSDFYRFYHIAARPVEFRFFAPICFWKDVKLNRFHGIVSSDLISNYHFSTLNKTILVENFDAFLGLVPQCKESLLIWTGGWRAATIKKLLPFLPKNKLYWGDIDKEGYEILGMMQEMDSNIQAVFMDNHIIQSHRHLVQKKPVFKGPFRNLGNLQKTYEDVCLNGLFIEQEQLLGSIETDF